MVLYHGSDVIVRNPEVRKQGTPKIFHGDSIALATTNKPLAGQKGRSRGIVNVFEYTESPMLNIKKFPK